MAIPGFVLGRGSRWPLEKRNRPSKWVTLDALRLLKRASPFGSGE